MPRDAGEMRVGGLAPTAGPDDGAAKRETRKRVERWLIDRTREQPWGVPLDYSNFRETRVDPERLWEVQTLDRLRRVKTTVDPDGIIRSAHSLG